MDFSVILFAVVVVTGLISAGYRLLFERSRVAVGAADADRRAATDGDAGPTQSLPLLVEYARALFPIVLLVFVLRSFVVEPFRIPSGSMLPNLHIGDFILVNKFSYGIRLPLINRKIIPVGAPERGDVMVFRYPNDPNLNFVKRVVGLPGDTIGYRDKKLFVNGQSVARAADGVFPFTQPKLRGRSAERHLETLDDSTYAILIDRELRGRDMEASVPPGHYFVLGDNRDHSNDSRYWRFVPEDHVVGKAFFIWFSWKSTSGGVHWSRIGNRIP